MKRLTVTLIIILIVYFIISCVFEPPEDNVYTIQIENLTDSTFNTLQFFRSINNVRIINHRNLTLSPGASHYITLFPALKENITYNLILETNDFPPRRAFVGNVLLFENGIVEIKQEHFECESQFDVTNIRILNETGHNFISLRIREVLEDVTPSWRTLRTSQFNDGSNVIISNIDPKLDTRKTYDLLLSGSGLNSIRHNVRLTQNGVVKFIDIEHLK